jgi:hypothetical protein
MTRPLLTVALTALAIAAPAQGYDSFEPDPVNCRHTVHHLFHHGGGKTTDIRVTFTSQRYTTCATAHAVANSFASTAGCHDTRYCHVHSGSYSCHSRYYAHSTPIAHCKALHEASGEVFLSWHRVDRG